MNKETAKDYLPLVQALAEGKVIQVMGSGGWNELPNYDFSLPVEHYRIKPEPREIWVNRIAPNGDSEWFHSKEAVLNAYLHSDPVCYREVIE